MAMFISTGDGVVDYRTSDPTGDGPVEHGAVLVE